MSKNAEPAAAVQKPLDIVERQRVLDAQAGDAAAREEIYRSHRERVYRLALFSVGDPVHAEDLTQAVFLKVFRELRRFRFQSNLATWIYRITHNECQDYHRRRPAAHVPIEDILGGGEDIAPGFDAEYAARERAAIVRDALLELPFRMREAVVLRYVEGLSYEEMAKVLGCATGTVASRLSRALEELEKQLRPFRSCFEDGRRTR